MATRQVAHSNTSWPRWVSSAAIRRVNRIGCTQFGQSGEVSCILRALRLIGVARKGQISALSRGNGTGAAALSSRPANKEVAPRGRHVTAQQYLQSQAEHCRRIADDTADIFVAEELRRLAADFDRRARATKPAIRAA